MRYRRKPEIVEAIQFREVSRTPKKFGDHVERNGMEIAEFMGVSYLREMTIPGDTPEGRTLLEIGTLIGRQSMAVGDWVVRKNGKFRFMPAAAFAAEYEPDTPREA